MERVKGGVLEGPALVIAKEEMRSDDEIVGTVNESIALLKRKEKGYRVYVFLYCCLFQSYQAARQFARNTHTTVYKKHNTT